MSAGPTPSARVAMVGAGQLARMTHQAAIALGVELRVLAASPDDPAVLAGAPHLLGSPGDLDALRALAAGADVMTFDHERIPPAHLATLEREGVHLAPRANAKLLAQDKLAARRTLTDGGFPVPPFATVSTREDVEAFATAHGWPLVAKTARGGYDGRGVFELPDPAAADELLAEGPSATLVEPRLALRRELAVLVARSATGHTAAYPVAETIQRDAMCREIIVPAPIEPALAARAHDLAVAIVEQIGATGIVAVELFETADGLVVNELAMRPHNSGHYTIEGCATSQFEQHLRAVLDWPLGSTELTAPAVTTVNVIGADDGTGPAQRMPSALSEPRAHVHLYGKRARPGRKLGHVTVCGPVAETVRAAAQRTASALEGRA